MCIRDRSWKRVNKTIPAPKKRIISRGPLFALITENITKKTAITPNGSINTPIFTIAKDLNVESNRILLACKKLGINAKGATKRLNKEELEKIKSYFDTGKNVSDEVINLNKVKSKISSKKIVEKVKIKYFANRLIRKS